MCVPKKEKTSKTKTKDKLFSTALQVGTDSQAEKMKVWKELWALFTSRVKWTITDGVKKRPRK